MAVVASKHARMRRRAQTSGWDTPLSALVCASQAKRTHARVLRTAAARERQSTTCADHPASDATQRLCRNVLIYGYVTHLCHRVDPQARVASRTKV